MLQDSSKVVNFLLKVVLRADDLSGPVMETSHHLSSRGSDDGTRSGDAGLCAWASCRWTPSEKFGPPPKDKRM